MLMEVVLELLKSSSKVINKVTSDLTKTTIIVISIFIVCIGYNMSYYVNRYSGMTEHKINSPL